MGYIFHKMNKEVLSFDCILDNEKILFNHYIMRKVNLNNMKNELEKNHFKISTRTASNDLNISLSKTHRMLKEFESLNIIKCIRIGDRKGTCSIYKYITDDETVFETVIKNKVERVKYCHIDNLKHINEMDNEIDTKTHKETSNIENINKEIYINIIDYLNKKSNKRFKYNTNKTIKCIRARINEGFDLEDFYKVIDTKVDQWLNTDMEMFIRPATLFSNKFEGYLNEKQFKNDKENTDIKPWDVEFEY